MLMRVFRVVVPALGTGVALALAFPTVGLYPLAWFGLVPLLAGTAGRSPGASAGRFFLAGLTFNVIALQWLLSNIMWAGGWAVLGQIILCAALSVYWALLGALWSWLRSHAPRWLAGPLTFALLWAAMEQLQAHWFSGMGWAALAHSQARDLYLLQLASVGTWVCLSFLVALVNALLAEALLAGRRGGIFAGAAAGLLVLAHGVGYTLLNEPTYSENPLRVGVFQSNFSLEMKWDPEYRIEAIRNAAEKSRALDIHEDVDVMVWPEALVLADLGDPRVAALLKKTLSDGNFALLTGVARWEGQQSFNSAVLLDAAGVEQDHYDKMHLAPFGEYVPLAERLPILSKLAPSIGNLSAGDRLVLFPVGDRRFGPLICFEVLFQPMAWRLREEGADALVVVTNLAWFGRSNAITQELEIARMRAVETRLPVVHASNTGISGVFDPYGRFHSVDILANRGLRLQPLRKNVPPEALIMQRAVGAFDLPNAAPQPFAPLQRTVPWATVGLAALVLLAAPLLARRRHSGTSANP